MRPLIQYDLDEPSTSAPSLPAAAPPHAGPSNARRPSAKKRKRNNNYQNSRRQQPPTKFQKTTTPIPHWDDPGSAVVGVLYDELELVAESVDMSAQGDELEVEGEEYGEEMVEGNDGVEGEGGGEAEEGSRELTHEEIWDDSALIDAWNSAEAEYEAYHGISKPWKTEAVKKSPLWYNKPHPASRRPSAGTKKAPSQKQEDVGPEPERDTAPLDFDTFVPTHDPSLADPSDTTKPKLATAAGTTTPLFVPPPSTTMVSRDEAFNNALSAMYWGGYWTAVYHCQAQSNGTSNKVPAETIEENGVDADEDEGEEVLVPTQR